VTRQWIHKKALRKLISESEGSVRVGEALDVAPVRQCGPICDCALRSDWDWKAINSHTKKHFCARFTPTRLADLRNGRSNNPITVVTR
jgi:hypothetical protein